MKGPVCGCGRPIGDQAFLCRSCVAFLERELGDVGGLADELETTRTRQSRTGGAAIGGGHSSERPLPWDDRPVVAGEALRVVLVGWVRVALDARGGRCPQDTLASMAGFLLASMQWLSHQPEVVAAKRDIEGAVWRLRSTVDRRADLVYLGPCGSMEYASNGDPILCSSRCPGDVYARHGASEATCPECESKHEVQLRRQWLLEQVEDQLAHPALLARALSNLGRPVADSTVRSWVERGRLVAHGRDARGRAVYRVGDVLDLVSADASKARAS